MSRRRHRHRHHWHHTSSSHDSGAVSHNSNAAESYEQQSAGGTYQQQSVQGRHSRQYRNQLGETGGASNYSASALALADDSRTAVYEQSTGRLTMPNGVTVHGHSSDDRPGGETSRNGVLPHGLWTVGPEQTVTSRLRSGDKQEPGMVLSPTQAGQSYGRDENGQPLFVIHPTNGKSIGCMVFPKPVFDQVASNRMANGFDKVRVVAHVPTGADPQVSSHHHTENGSNGSQGGHAGQRSGYAGQRAAAAAATDPVTGFLNKLFGM